MRPSLTSPQQGEPLSEPRSELHSGLSSELRTHLESCRRRTLDLVKGITPTVLNKQSHPDFSPVGWHLGHIAYTEALWILGEPLGEESDRYEILFAADGLPKAERENLPPLSQLLAYLDTVRFQVLERIECADPRLVHWLLQHEGQHAETMAMVMAMHERNPLSLLQKLPHQLDVEDGAGMIFVKGSEFWQGADAPWAIDNERPRHRADVKDFWIDQNLVTCSQFAQFMAMGGYTKEKWWSQEGWAWQQQAKVSEPLHWSDDLAVKDKPVCGVSGYEAEAFARSRGKRLPSEAEWECAAAICQCVGMFGGVWEWTATGFDAYAGFEPFPYAGYSQAYFDGEHRVLKGGSWASPKSIMRKSFRNWYHPHRRELFAGFRCAQ